MAIQYVGGQTVTTTVTEPSTATITFALTGGIASTPAAGDFVLLSYNNGLTTNRDLSAVVTTSGYTLLADLYANDSFDANMAVFTKLMGGTPDSNVVVVGRPGSASVVIVHISVFRGVDTSIPLDVTSTTATGIDTGNVNPAAITPITDGNVIAIFGSGGVGTSARAFTAGSVAYMSGFMQANGAGSSQGTISGTGYVSGQPANTAYNPAAWAINTDSISNSWAALTVALRASITSGTASGPLTISGASTGAAIIAAASSGDMAISGAAIASVLASAYASGMIALSGSALGGSAKILIAAGSIDIAGSATSTVQLSAAASGQIDLTGSAQGGVAIVAASSGQIGITGAADGEVSYNTGEASGTLAFTGAAIGAIYVQGSVAGAISFSLASYGKHLWLQQPPTDETWSVQAANSEIWQPVSGSGTAWE